MDPQQRSSVLWKAFAVIDAFDQNHRVMSFSDIARRSGLSKSTTHRVLAMLQEVQAIEPAGKGYKIGLRMLSAGALSVDARQHDIVFPHLERLRLITKQTVHMAVLDNSEVVYIEKLPSAQSPDTPALVGGRMPAMRTGVGKALLAFGGSGARLSPRPSVPSRAGCTSRVLTPDRLADIRCSGIARDREEASPGLACTAVPVLVADQAIAAISVAFPASDGSGERFVNPLRETATALGRALAMRRDVRL